MMALSLVHLRGNAVDRRSHLQHVSLNFGRQPAAAVASTMHMKTPTSTNTHVRESTRTTRKTERIEP